MRKKRTIDFFFKRIEDADDPNIQTQSQPQTPRQAQPQPQTQTETQTNVDNIMEDLLGAGVEPETIATSNLNEVKFDSLIRDPGVRPPLSSYPSNLQDEIRRTYIKLGPYQLIKSHYPLSLCGRQKRSFQAAWFKRFWWLEYSDKTNSAFCFPCYLFGRKPIGRVGSDTFTVKGFNRWRKVNSGKECPFVNHEGMTPSSGHNFSVRCYEDLKNKLCHIENVIDKQTELEIIDNRLRLQVTIDSTRWLTLQTCPLRGGDERPTSLNRGNLLELRDLIASYNKDVARVVSHAPKNAKYTSPDVQKEILQMYAMKVQESIRDEIGNAKFCLIVDESQDESKKEQMAICVRFVDRKGYIKERFLDLVHVNDTNALTLKNGILASLSYLKLDVQDIRGQGYDGASNMRGEWNGLKALILKECPFAYYVHCFAHQLQLALVAASKDVSEVHTFFKHLNFIVNVIGSSTKRNDQLQEAQIDEISHLAEIGELEGGRGSNQMQNLQRAGDTRWSSHFKSICSLLRLFGPTRVVLNDIYLGRATSSQKGDAKYALTNLLSFDFVLVLHLMKEIMGITDKLCKALQNKSQDIVNALTLVSTTKTLIQKLRDDGWKSLLDKVVCFCEKYSIHVPDMNVTYKDIIQSRQKKDNVTVEHHYRVDVFIVAIDSQLQELNNRFSESVSELLRLSATLDPKKSFNKDDICKLVSKYYPLDFTEQDKIELQLELQHYELDNDPKLKNVTLSELCKGLQETEKSETYPLIDRLIRLILTLPVSTATSERAFSKMKLVKTRLRSTMSDDFLKSSLILSVEREIVRSLCTDDVIDDFYFKTQRRVQMKKHKVSSSVKI